MPKRAGGAQRGAMRSAPSRRMVSPFRCVLLTMWQASAANSSERGDNEVKPYQSPMEDGMQHFHKWYQRRMGEHAPE